jgi:hypothetical protein
MTCKTVLLPVNKHQISKVNGPERGHLPMEDIMEIINLTFEDHKPVKATFSMTVDEVAHLAKLLGSMSYNDVDDPNRWEALSDFYDMVTDDIFNRYWDDGIRDYLKEM